MAGMLLLQMMAKIQYALIEFISIALWGGLAHWGSEMVKVGLPIFLPLSLMEN